VVSAVTLDVGIDVAVTRSRMLKRIDHKKAWMIMIIERPFGDIHISFSCIWKFLDLKHWSLACDHI